MTSNITDRLNGFTTSAAMKNPVACATTANITLSGEQTIDDITTSSDRVLVKNQTDTTENGIYDSASGTWTRAKDFESTRDVLTGTTVFVVGGTTNAGLYYYVSTASDPDPGDAMAWTQAPLGGAATTADGVTYDPASDDISDTDVQAAIGTLAENVVLDKGSAIASATTTELGAADSHFVSITGTTTITGFGSTGDRELVWVKFDGALILTYNATSMILPTAANITTVAGDIALFSRVSGANWQCLNYLRADGSSVSGSAGYSLTAETAITSLQSTDQMLIADNSDSNANKKITFANFITQLAIDTAQLVAGAVTGPKIAMGSDAQGDVLFRGASNYERLAAGTSGHFLQSQGAGADPQWAATTGIASVSQGDLNTSTGTFSQNTSNTIDFGDTGGPASYIVPGDPDTHIVLPGGQYGFVPQSKTASTNWLSGWWLCTNSTSYEAAAMPFIYDSAIQNNKSVQGQQRYVTASPPFDMGDGEAGGFIFLLMNKDGTIEASYRADVPPWGYNGPTNIMADKINRDNGKKYRKVIKAQSFEEIMDGGQPKYIYEEITQNIKNADMDLIPHPFGGTLKPDQTVIMLDPMSDDVARMIEAQNAGYAEEIDEKFDGGFVKIDNTALKRKGPEAVQQVRFTLK